MWCVQPLFTTQKLVCQVNDANGNSLTYLTVPPCWCDVRNAYVMRVYVRCVYDGSVPGMGFQAE